jgi:hypothetical protein
MSRKYLSDCSAGGAKWAGDIQSATVGDRRLTQTTESPEYPGRFTGRAYIEGKRFELLIFKKLSTSCW